MYDSTNQYNNANDICRVSWWVLLVTAVLLRIQNIIIDSKKSPCVCVFPYSITIQTNTMEMQAQRTFFAIFRMAYRASVDFPRNEIRNELHKLKKMNSNLLMSTTSTFNNFALPILFIFNVRYSCCFEYGVAGLVSRVFSRTVPCAICFTFPPSLPDSFAYLTTHSTSYDRFYRFFWNFIRNVKSVIQTKIWPKSTCARYKLYATKLLSSKKCHVFL